MIKRDVNGIWTSQNVPKGTNPVYAQALVDFFNVLDPLFSRAQEKSDFDMGTTTLRVDLRLHLSLYIAFGKKGSIKKLIAIQNFYLLIFLNTKKRK